MIWHAWQNRAYALALGVGLMLGLAIPVLAQGGEAVQFAPTKFNNMTEMYEYNKEHGRATLVTSDSVLHTAHVLFDYTLRAAELRQFDTNLRELSSAMQMRMSALAEEEACRRYIIAPPPYGYDRVAAYFGVGEKLLNPDAKMPEIIRGMVDKEVALILAHKHAETSPVMGVYEDYTQYVPRGHYTRNEQFQRYFRAMMWFGRAGFPISGEKAPGVPLTREEARANAWAGIELARNLDGSPLYRSPDSPTYIRLWQSIYDPTQFIVGQSDDLMPLEYAALTKKVFGDTLPGGWTPQAQAQTDQFITEAIALRPPKILGTVQYGKNPPVALRLFGQRFVPDSYVFQQLVHPNVTNRLMPTGLDVMAVLGSPRALELLKARGELTADYTRQLTMLQADFAKRTDAEWTSTAYLIWLRTLRDLVTDNGVTAAEVLPAWWSSPAWQTKQLNTGLGSWAELRHDTILYVKQSYTPLRAAMPMTNGEVVVYVEPVPQVYGGIITLLSTMREQLTQRGVFPEEMGPNYDQFLDLLHSLQVVAMQERNPLVMAVTREEPTVEESLASLRNIGAVLKNVETLPQPLRDQLTGDEDAQAAIIADVHTDPNSRRVLEVGVGKVMTVTVPVPGPQGTVQATGPIFSYYEFTHPMDDRLTDAAWQSMLQQGKAGTPLVLGEYLPK